MFNTLQDGVQGGNALANMSSLDLGIPTTHDVGELAKALGTGARQQLRHLRLVIVDKTGPSGSHSYMGEEDNWDDALAQDD